MEYTPSSKRLSSESLHCALRIAAYPDRKDVTNFKIALQVPTMRQRHSCISHGSNVDHNALRSYYATVCNAQCNNSEDNLL